MAKRTGMDLGSDPVKENCAPEMLEALFKWACREGMEFILIVLDNKKDNNLKGIPY